YGQSPPRLLNNNYENNYYNGICVLQRTVTGDTTWDDQGIPYVILDELHVLSGRSLTVEAGTVVKFGWYRAGFSISGSLRVLGTEASPVIFTSLHDDTVGGDTNNNGNATLPSSGDWSYIGFEAHLEDTTSIIEHAIIRYGGREGGSGLPTLGAIHLDRASPTVRYSTVTNNVTGISAVSSTPTLGCNNIYDNDHHGLHNATPATPISAENQWWGDPSGPAGTGPGSGDAVSEGVDFSPWATSPCGESIPDVSVTVAGSPDPVLRGNQLTYALTVSNGGSGDAPGAELAVTLPAGLHDVSVKAEQGSCTVAASTVSCMLGTIAAGDTIAVSITATVGPASPAQITVTAMLLAVEGEGNSDNNQSSATTTVMSRVLLPVLVR
ncbi:MAG: DUF11 domain-containing protein, partial [Candidatus Promineifilaceae bacterium]|nr:DUF11 domain-containing protein [Candidatus Promineifilaceae bacterium]